MAGDLGEQEVVLISLTEENQQLRKDLADLAGYAQRTWEIWEEGKHDHKVGKRLRAMAGDLKGYDATMDRIYKH
jgi:hypothetical protein